jgi:hypothetical protein
MVFLLPSLSAFTAALLFVKLSQHFWLGQQMLGTYWSKPNAWCPAVYAQGRQQTLQKIGLKAASPRKAEAK